METLNNISGTPEEQGGQTLSLFFPQDWLQKKPRLHKIFSTA
jgi:hypothetical protein